MLDKLFKFLLIIYPPIMLWNPEELFIINRIIGISFIAIFLLKTLTIKNSSIDKLGLIILSFISLIFISTVVNNSFNLINVNISTKYISPFIIGYYSLRYIKAKFLQKYFIFYFWFFFIVWLIRFAQFSFPFSTVTSIRDELWWGKAVVFGFLYAVFYFGYVLIKQNTSKKFQRRKYLLAVPLLFMGSRSVILGAMLIFLIYFLSDLKISSKKIKLGLVYSLLIGVFSYSFLFEYILGNDILAGFLGSEMDLRSGNDVTMSSFSSGRTDVWDLYLQSFSLIDLFFGYGGLNFDIGFSLHNDLLEMFFFYGIFGFVIFLLLVYNIYLKPGFQSKNPLRIVILFFILFQLFFNPFSSTMSAIFFVMLLLNYDNGKLSHSA